MRKSLQIIILLFSALQLLAQSADEADRLFNAGQYSSSREIYGRLLQRAPSNTLYLYRFARCEYELGHDSTSIEYFLKAGGKYTLAYYYLGELYMRQWEFDKAMEYYQLYLSSVKAPNEREPLIQKQLEQAELLRRYLKHVQQICISSYKDVPVDSLLFAFDEFGITQFDEDNHGNTSFTSLREDRELLTISDSSSSYFVTRERLLDSWTEWDTLPATVHFTNHVNYPFLLADGVTLYYAAQDTLGFGGWDIYVTRFNSSSYSFTKPENIGFPFNSAANDYLFAVNEAEGYGLWATDRFSPEGFARIYRFRWDEQKQYVRDLSEQELVDYAKLKNFCLWETEENLPAEEVKEQIQNQQPQENNEQLTPELLLEQLRIQYGLGSDADKKRLTPIILDLEQKVEQAYRIRMKL
ncbi:MAG: hypothetical protein MJZ82_01745 [Paludibacteraceae bacterium]|nr:hypothetical protein [Paludibacteraceae bacterium]